MKRIRKRTRLPLVVLRQRTKLIRTIRRKLDFMSTMEMQELVRLIEQRRR